MPARHVALQGDEEVGALCQSAEAALLALSHGYLTHPRNVALRRQLAHKALDTPELYAQLLRLTCRLLLRASRGLPATINDFGPTGLAFDCAQLRQAHIAPTTLRRLAEIIAPPAPRPSWRTLNLSHMGGIYEHLVGLTPAYDMDRNQLAFVNDSPCKPWARKVSGTYYTPLALVDLLLERTLDPLIRSICRHPRKDAVAALLTLRIVDPACGTGHFLLAAAKRLAFHVARIEGVSDGSGALHRVLCQCIFGVDRNPTAVEVARHTLVSEAGAGDDPHLWQALQEHVVVGDALVGLHTSDVVRQGIPQGAYSGTFADDKACLRALAQKNAAARSTHFVPPPNAVTPSQERLAADLYVAAFLCPKVAGNMACVPLTDSVWAALRGEAIDADMQALAQNTSARAAVMHWYAAFAQVQAVGGFDVVLCNPPWEVSQIDEGEYFAQRHPEIARLTGAHRKARIAALEHQDPALWGAFRQAKREQAGANVWLRMSGRYAFSGARKLNRYALFVQTCLAIKKPQGRAGMVVPSGLFTDDNCRHVFAALRAQGLVEVLDFENQKPWFAKVDARTKFSLVTLGDATKHSDTTFACFLNDAHQADDTHRRVTYGPDDYALFNPNTHTVPLFRSTYDANLTAKIYRRVPVLVNTTTSEGNPWGMTFRQGLFNMTSDANAFVPQGYIAPSGSLLPLYEAKMVHHFDHRWATMSEHLPHAVRAASYAEKSDPAFAVRTQHLVSREDVERRLCRRAWPHPWLLVYRNITNATNERTVVASCIPRVGVGNSLYLMFPTNASPQKQMCLLADLSSVVHDYVARQKLGGTNLNLFYKQQIATLPPDAYSKKAMDFIVPRVCELVCVADDMAPLALALGYDGGFAGWDKSRRALLRAELDAYFAALYGLTREELHYVFEPTALFNAPGPWVTFPGMARREMAEHGEYLSRRLTLSAWDALRRDTILPV